MTDRGWGISKISAMLYVFGAGAAAVNLYFASLIGSWMGFTVLTPLQAVTGGAVLGLPISWFFARYIKSLMDQAP